MSEFTQTQYGLPVASQSESIKKAFLVKTYSHLMLCVGIFAACLYLMVTSKAFIALTFSIYSLPFAPFIILAAIVGISFATTFFVNSHSKPLQYVGLTLYPVMEAFLFVPMILSFLGRDAIGGLVNASFLTVLIFGCLSLAVVITKPDLGFMGKFLMFASFASIATIVLSLIFGFTLGTWFTIAMIGLACGYILYQTSNILNTTDTEGYIGAGLSLFASVAMLFFYILRFFNSRD
jgi:FtsH-binding integral membrane protein